ncbi:DgyrCDS9216 [Dimorphilus gyrociliatus]|uniref:DgyrCDS9216 n=1 Tax=Dimorphilus gyrociliatus TaxID=2664684 RepID=A0A7I8VWD1_9ANNE|nr:DgyrCDS9216 [Dimorphilus gyrociliatus]
MDSLRTSLFILKDKRLGVCGAKNTATPPTDECFTFLMNDNGCPTKNFEAHPYHKEMTIEEFSSSVNLSSQIIRQSKYNKTVKNEYIRQVCLGNSGINIENVALHKQVSHLGYFKNPLYHPTHAVDGLRLSNASHGTCVLLEMLETVQPTLKIMLNAFHAVRKVVIWPTNENVYQLFLIYMQDRNDTCKDNILVKNNTETEVYCSATMNSHDVISIEQKLKSPLYICEIEVFSENLATKKLFLTKQVSHNGKLNDGFLNNYLSYSLKQEIWIAINLLAYYNVYGFDAKVPQAYSGNFGNFYVEVSNDNPSLFEHSIESKKCIEIDNFPIQSENFQTFGCVKGGVEGQFFKILTKSASSIQFSANEIEIFGIYLRSSDQKNNNLLFHKPSWASSVQQNLYSGFRLTDGEDNAYFKTNLQAYPWCRIDLLGVFRINSMGIIGWVSQHASLFHLRGLVSYKYDFSPQNTGDSFQTCFINNIHMSPREYRIWNCTMSNPTGRYVTFYLHASSQLLLQEAEVYGEEIINNNFYNLPIVLADRNSNNTGFPSIPHKDQFPSKAIDRLPHNIYHEELYYSCSSNYLANGEEGKFTFHLDNHYLIHQIVLLLRIDSNDIRDVQLVVENNLFPATQRQICDLQTTNKGYGSYQAFNCSLVGDRVSFYKIGGNNLFSICEIYVFGRKQPYSLNEYGNMVLAERGFSSYSSDIILNTNCNFHTRDIYIQFPNNYRFTAVGFTIMTTANVIDGLNIYGIEYNTPNLCVQVKYNIKIIKPTIFTFNCESEMIAKYIQIKSISSFFQFCNFFIISKGISQNNQQDNFRLENKRLLKPAYSFYTEKTRNALECYHNCSQNSLCADISYKEANAECSFSIFHILPLFKHVLTSSSNDYQHSISQKQQIDSTLVCSIG